MKSISISARRKKRKQDRANANAALNPPGVVEHAAEIMRHFKPTPFSGEGRLIESVRRNRVLAGWPFQVADESARDLAIAALRKIGWAVRPRDSEAGPIVTGNKICPSCGEETISIFTSVNDRLAYPLRFCSFSCAHKAKLNRYRSAETRNCDFCHKEFAALSKANGAREDSRFCSQFCYLASIAAERHDPRRCENPKCGKTFTPPRGPKGRDQRFCSQTCFKAANASQRKAPPRPCEHCGEIFQSTQYGAQALTHKYCSRACFLEANRRAEKTCQQCGGLFFPTKATRQFCSNRCSALFRTSRGTNTFRCEAV